MNPAWWILAVAILVAILFVPRASAAKHASPFTRNVAQKLSELSPMGVLCYAVAAFCLFLTLYGIVGGGIFTWYSWTHGRNTIPIEAGSVGVPRHYFVTAYPNQETKLESAVPDGWRIEIKIKHPTAGVWVRPEGKERYIDRAGTYHDGTGFHGWMYFQSAERFPVVVEVDIHPPQP